MEHHTAQVTHDEKTNHVVHAWLGTDDRDVVLEVVAVEKPDCLLVIHVMPADLRNRR